MSLFGKPAVGLAIDDRSLEFVALTKNGAQAKIIAKTKVIVPQGIIDNGLIKDKKTLSRLLEEALAGAQPNHLTVKRLAFCLPESQTYSLVLSLPQHEISAREDLIKDLALANLPLTEEQLLYSYKIIQAAKKETWLFLAAVNRASLLEWLEFFRDLGWAIDLVDNETFAAARSLLKVDQGQPLCLVDNGSIKTHVAIKQAEAIYYSGTFNLGGHYLTKKIAQNFKLTMLTAEKKKIELGLNKQIFPVVAKSLALLAEEIKSAVAFYHREYGAAVKTVLLLGGGSQLKGLAAFLQETVGLSVINGQPSYVVEKLTPDYYAAAGAAWRTLNLKDFANEPNYLPLLEEKNILTKPIKFGRSEVVPAPEDEADLAPTESTESTDTEDDLNMTDEENEALTKKIEKEKKILLVILLVGFVAIWGAYVYRERAKESRSQEASRRLAESYGQIQEFTFKLPVVIDAVNLTPGEIKGRLIETATSEAVDYAAAVADGKGQARNLLQAGESLWEEPVNEIVSQTNLSFPINWRWLAYDQKQAMAAALAQIDGLNTQKLPYSFNSWQLVALIKGTELNKLYLQVKIAVSLNGKIDAPLLAETPPEPTTPATTSPASDAVASTSPSLLDGQQVLITETETGWLNIRRGPGTAFEVIDKVNVGTKLLWLQEEKEWLEVELPSGLKGWGLSRYMQKL